MSRGVVVSLLLAGCADQSARAEEPPPIVAEPSERAESPAHVLRVAFVSDLNGSYGSMTYEGTVHGAIARLVELAPDVVISTGDMVAGQRRGLDYDAMWSAFHVAVTDPLTRAGIPFAFTPGNHDASAYQGFGDERDAFVRAFASRRPHVEFVDDGSYPRRYAFHVGGALFVSLDATVSEPIDAEQLAWLEALLVHDESEVTIVFGHLPIHPLTRGREREAMFDDALARVLAANDVDAYVSGHHHGYFPARDGDLRLIGVGCLGAGSRRLIGTDVAREQSFVLVDIEGGAITRVEAYEAPTFMSPILRADLPRTVGELVRDDLALPKPP